jgi:hypothetical protein
MGALPVISNVYRVAANWRESGTGQTAENVIHVYGAGTTALGMADVVASAWQPGQGESAVLTAAIQSFTVTPLDGISASYTKAVTGGTYSGNVSGAWVPQVAPVVSLRTAKRGRSYRGRVYIPFAGEGQIENGLLSSGYALDLQEAWTAFQTALESSDFYLAVASYHLAVANRVTNIIVEQATGTQRRRQERVRYP